MAHTIGDIHSFRASGRNKATNVTLNCDQDDMSPGKLQCSVEMRLPVQFTALWDTPREFNWQENWNLVGKLFADKVKNKLRETNLIRDKVNEMTKKELKPLFEEAAFEVFGSKNKWKEEWVCKSGYTELTAELGIYKNEGGGQVMIDLCADEIGPFKGDDINPLSSSRLQDIISWEPEVIYDVYMDKRDADEGLVNSGIDTVPMRNLSFVRLEKSSVVNCFQEDNCFIDHYIPLD